MVSKRKQNDFEAEWGSLEDELKEYERLKRNNSNFQNNKKNDPESNANWDVIKLPK